MRRPWFNAPSLGTLHPLGYVVVLVLLMLGGVQLTLHFVFLITMAVPVVGAWQRKPARPWRVAAVISILAAAGFLLARWLQPDAQPLLFYSAADEFGFMAPRIDALNLLVVGAIFLPLSAACALDRLRPARSKLRESP